MQFISSIAHTLSPFINMLPDAVAKGLIWGIMALGVYITYKILDYSDLTVDGSIVTGGAVFAILIINGIPIPVAMAAAFVAGSLAGLLTALLHTRLGIPPILSGILTQLGLYSINLRIMGAPLLTTSVDKFPLLVTAREKIPSCFVALLFVVAIIGLMYWFFGTELGCAIRSTGANANMSRAQGINTNNTKLLGLMLGNGLVGLSGALVTQYTGQVNAAMGAGTIVTGLAAIIIGSVLFDKLFSNFALKLAAVIVGAILYNIVTAFVIQLGLETDDLKLLSATFVAIFLAVPYLKEKLHIRKKSKGGACRA